MTRHSSLASTAIIIRARYWDDFRVPSNSDRVDAYRDKLRVAGVVDRGCFARPRGDRKEVARG